MTKPTLNTHILAIITDPKTFAPWMTWVDRETGEGTPLFEMIAIGPHDDKPDPAVVKEREAEIEKILGYPIGDARNLYAVSRADPLYDAIVMKYHERERAAAKRIVIEDHSDD